MQFTLARGILIDLRGRTTPFAVAELLRLLVSAAGRSVVGTINSELFYIADFYATIARCLTFMCWSKVASACDAVRTAKLQVSIV